MITERHTSRRRAGPLDQRLGLRVIDAEAVHHRLLAIIGALTWKLGGERLGLRALNGELPPEVLGTVGTVASGAYQRVGGLLPFLTCLMAPGVYDIPDVQAGFRQAVTNTTPIGAYRGAGRPEATYADAPRRDQRRAWPCRRRR